MNDQNRQRLVVLLKRSAKRSATEIAADLEAIAGVEVVSKSKSFLDLEVDTEAVAAEDLDAIVEELEGELHSRPEAQLIDPIPPSKIP